jgi:lipoyl-dependent peroxiredoxin
VIEYQDFGRGRAYARPRPKSGLFHDKVWRIKSRKDLKMAEINRKAGAIWNGDSRTGKGTISTESQALFEEPYTHKMRFVGSEVTGTNPEELIAAANAACFSMALASTLKKNGYDPEQIETTATITLMSESGNNEITDMYLHVRAYVPGLDEASLQNLISAADEHCPVSNLLRNGLDIRIEAELIHTDPAPTS